MFDYHKILFALILISFVLLCERSPVLKGQEPSLTTTDHLLVINHVRDLLKNEMDHAEKRREEIIKRLEYGTRSSMHHRIREADYHFQLSRKKLLVWEYTHLGNANHSQGDIVEQLRECFTLLRNNIKLLADYRRGSYHAGVSLLTDWLTWEKYQDDLELERLNFELSLSPDSQEVRDSISEAMVNAVARSEKIVNEVDDNPNRKDDHPAFKEQSILARLNLIRTEILKESWNHKHAETAIKSDELIEKLKILYARQMCHSLELAFLRQKAFYDGWCSYYQWLDSEAFKYATKIEKTKFDQQWDTESSSDVMESLYGTCIENAKELYETISKARRAWLGDLDYVDQAKILLLRLQKEHFLWRFEGTTDSDERERIIVEVRKILDVIQFNAESHAKRMETHYEAGLVPLQDWLEAEVRRAAATVDAAVSRYPVRRSRNEK